MRAALTVVIARLDRTIQYSVTSAIYGEAAAYWIPRSSAQLRTRRGMTPRPYSAGLAGVDTSVLVAACAAAAFFSTIATAMIEPS